MSIEKGCVVGEGSIDDSRKGMRKTAAYWLRESRKPLSKTSLPSWQKDCKNMAAYLKQLSERPDAGQDEAF